ncbi:hypothetical protein H1230_13250 [Paenibacillus sp. 19GGS1-52]|uniref:hypothetical protein n=1 Tax=Paenibacillus sp. 19GGS1-52 TaxID=2758563 RepID=UPI001EFB4226|nr:hypothetical protein [Paenibacillus sp. 19GGS1-52]ULO09647.1 hypothetical protein H1230_13250 [Paenibacillus sp. 19GGS1-52]
MVTNMLGDSLIFNRLMWVMSDEDFEEVHNLSTTHFKLVNEHFDAAPERQAEIVEEVELLRSRKAALFAKYQN